MSRFASKLFPEIELNYDVREGLAPENVFFIHGNIASNRWWLPAEKVWKEHAGGQALPGSLVYAEFPGCGESKAPSKASDVDMHKFADVFIEMIQSFERGPFHLVGHSTGGLIAALMLAKAPQLFRKAVLLDPVGATGVRLEPAIVNAFESMKTNRELTATIIGATIFGNDPDSTYFKEVIVEDAFKAVKAVGHWVVQALDGLDVRKELATIEAAVLVLHGEHDQLLPIADSKALAGLIPRGEFRILAGRGHCANVENPTEFVKAVREFLFSPTTDTSH